MRIEEASNKASIEHGNVESRSDEEFFEFEDVKSVFNNYTEEEISERQSKEEVPTCKFCWSA